MEPSRFETFRRAVNCTPALTTISAVTSGRWRLREADLRTTMIYIGTASRLTRTEVALLTAIYAQPHFKRVHSEIHPPLDSMSGLRGRITVL